MVGGDWTKIAERLRNSATGQIDPHVAKLLREIAEDAARAELADRIERAGGLHIPLPLSKGGGLTNLLTREKDMIVAALRIPRARCGKAANDDSLHPRKDRRGDGRFLPTGRQQIGRRGED